jgi:tRNA(fMet)-specific endonuclease VapC
MKYILDTDTLIYFLKGHTAIVEKISQYGFNQLATTIINHSELIFGVFNSSRKKINFEIVTGFLKNLTLIPFCEQASFIFAEQKATLRSQGEILADLDLMIASIALKQRMILVTNNTKHFSRIKNLALENWY